ncbi:hypothetical protein PAHAL_8G105600 [Panicum hallii]|jgi:hypothetical protein|uniref:Uncharacterized protein n=1 Tax=Panicum hallii TaxID=206008 RepID=A0A2S3IDX5_9POAL|nr:uncharacterized protein LOC112902461 [Panicum hallii]PAN42329.1 hypothetical protein PAHAL_8G105600 [Panicum hallii]
MECRTKLGPLLRANAALRVLPPGSHRRIHFPPGPASSSDEEQYRPPASRRWFHAAYARLLRHAGSLNGVDHAEGLPRHAATGSVVACPHVAARAAHFDALAGEFVAAAAAASRGHPPPKMKGTSLSSLTRVCDVLGVSAQRRKSVRLTVCPQVTQHHVWRGALEAVLGDLQADLASLDGPSPATQMAEQIASACTRFLSGTADAATSSTPSWMRPTPFKKPAEPPPPAKKWQEVLDMFTDLARSLETDDRLAGHAQKVEAMKEGLYQIRDVVIERDIAFKEARRQDCLVQRKLSKSLGHSSRCLYTLLLFYLYGTVRDIEVHVGKCVSGKGGRDVAAHAAKFITGGDELAVRGSIKQLSRALGVFRFVWDAANTEFDAANDNGKDAVVKKKNEVSKGVLELQGHLWGFGVEEKAVTYRGDVFHVHQIQLP